MHRERVNALLAQFRDEVEGIDVAAVEMHANFGRSIETRRQREGLPEAAVLARAMYRLVIYQDFSGIGTIQAGNEPQ